MLSESLLYARLNLQPAPRPSPMPVRVNELT
jgi:hypothetical protein